MPPATSSIPAPSRRSSSTSSLPSGRTARTPCITSSTPTRASARCSPRSGGGRTAVPAAADADLSLLDTDAERELIKQLAALPEEIRLAARDYDPSRINKYVTELAARFHRFYTVCRIKGAETGVLEARLLLADTVRRVLAVALGIIGVSAPEKM